MIGTVIIGAIIALIAISIVVCSIRAKKKGKSSCSCSCSGCAMSSICHKDNANSK